VPVLYQDSVRTAQQTVSASVILNQSANIVSCKSRCLLSDPYKTHKRSVSTVYSFSTLNLVVRREIARLEKVKMNTVIVLSCEQEVVKSGAGFFGVSMAMSCVRAKPHHIFVCEIFSCCIDLVHV
jgi:hypothetical protein